MKIGIIGAGAIVREFLPELVKMDGIEIVGVLGRPQSKERVEVLCAENGVPNAVYRFADLVAIGIDTVYIAVPNSLHFTYCEQALRAGLHVIVEKPIMSNDQEVAAIQRMAMENKRFVFEAVTTPYFESFRKIKEWLNRIGAVKLVQCNYSQYSRRYKAFLSGELPPAFDPAQSGGALMDLNVYNLHFLMGLFASPLHAQYFPNIERGIDTSGTLVLQYPDFIATCTAAKDCAAPYSFVIQGTEGYITTQYPPNFIGEVCLHLYGKGEERYNDHTAMHRVVPEFRFFADCIDRGDFAGCMARLDQSLAVSRVQTRARLESGIVFAADSHFSKPASDVSPVGVDRRRDGCLAAHQNNP